MQRGAALRCIIFSFLAIAVSAAIPPSPIMDSAKLTSGAAALATDVRLIVRYGDVVAKSAAKTEAQTQGIRGMSGVLGVKALPHLGMAVVRCESQAAMEVLAGWLAKDTAVELIVPDTLLRIDGQALEISLLNDTDAGANDTEVDGNMSSTISTTATPAATTATTTFPWLVPDDPLFPFLWGLSAIEAPKAWHTCTGEQSPSLVVGVIDTGIDYTHEDLREQMWVNSGEIPGNGVDDDGNGYVDDVHGANFVSGSGDPMDDNGHGTHCGGTIAGAGNNKIGVIGVAWRGVKLMALKFLAKDGSGRTSDAIAALNYAVANGARITSNSWGGDDSSSVMRVAIERAEVAGMLFIAAAGNSATDNDVNPQFPANYPVDNVVSVASTQVDSGLSSFSCYGARTVHVAAPGSNILSTVPGNLYKSLSGTSMATPHVSGLAALIWMYRPHLTAADVKAVLLNTAARAEALAGRTITGAQINAKRAMDFAETLRPPHLPLNPPQGIDFRDTDGALGVIQGTIRITAAMNESDVEYYKVFLVSPAGFPLGVLGEVNATGAPTVDLVLSEPIVLPMYASALVVVSGGELGELLPWVNGADAPHMEIEDFVVPAFPPRGLSWSGDMDPRAGFVAGTFRIDRAENEDTMTAYNVYWRVNGSSAPGPLLASIPVAGYVAPRCIFGTCQLLNMTELENGNGRRFSRFGYGASEEAIIALSGPARVRVTTFSTEYMYDVLKIGSVLLSGNPTLPLEVDLPEGKTSIAWMSDYSINGAGWSFEVVQSDTTAEVSVGATVPLGSSVVVHSSYGSIELALGPSALIGDYDGERMPPSIAFAPEALRFEDRSVSPGVIEGLAKVLRAADMCEGAVTYYQVSFADEAEEAIGEGWNASVGANGTKCVDAESSPAKCWVEVEITRTAVPVGAVKLVARAGNKHGLGSGRASTAFVKFAEVPGGARKPAAKPVAAPRLRGAIVGHVAADVASAPAPAPAIGVLGDVSARPPAPQGTPTLSRSESAQEPWLQHLSKKTGSSDIASSAAVRPAVGRLLCSVTFAGMDVSSGRVPAPEVRRVLAQEIARAIGSSDQFWVHVEVLRMSAADAPIRATGRGQATAVDFEVAPTAQGEDAGRTLLDAMEARLLMLATGGPSARRFDEAVAQALARLGSHMVDPSALRSTFGKVSQVPASSGHWV